MKILKFYADWCGPCRILAKNLEVFKEKHPDIEVVSINVENDEELSAKYNIRNVPVLIKLVDDVETARRVGLATVADLENFVYS